MRFDLIFQIVMDSLCIYEILSVMLHAVCRSERAAKEALSVREATLSTTKRKFVDTQRSLESVGASLYCMQNCFEV